MTEPSQRDQAARYRDFYVHAPHAYFSVGADGRVCDCNPRAEALLGRCCAGLIGSPVLELYAETPDGRAKAQLVFQRFLAGETIEDVELQMQRADGSPIWISLSVNSVKDEAGRVLESRSIAVDISRRKRAERALLESRASLAHAQAQARLGSWDWDRESGAIACSDEALHIFGFQPGEVEPTFGLFMTFVHPDDRERLKTALAQAVEHRGTYELEHRVVLRDGSLRHLCERGRVTVDDTGRPVRVIGTVQDVTEQRIGRLALQESEERLRMVIETTPGPLALGSIATGRFELANEAFLSTLRMRREDLAEFRTSMVYADPERDRPRLLAALAEQGRVSQMPILARRRDGTTFAALVSSVHFAQGETDTVLTSIVDISEQQRAQSQLEAALAEKEVLLREVHHRVKNNLNTIAGMLYLQRRALVDAQATAAFLDSERRIQSMARIHEHLYQSGNLAEVDMAAYLRQLAEDLDQSYGRRGIATMVEASEARLDIDRAIACGLLVQELVSNAHKHAFPDPASAGRILIRLHGEGDRWTLEVADDGAGLPAGAAVETVASLGLRLANMLARQLRGRIEMQSAAGAGTTFRIWFPESESKEEA